MVRDEADCYLVYRLRLYSTKLVWLPWEQVYHKVAGSLGMIIHLGFVASTLMARVCEICSVVNDSHTFFLHVSSGTFFKHQLILKCGLFKKLRDVNLHFLKDNAVNTLLSDAPFNALVEICWFYLNSGKSFIWKAKAAASLKAPIFKYKIGCMGFSHLATYFMASLNWTARIHSSTKG